MVSNWKNISIKKIAKASGFGTATVDRVLNKRDGVSAASISVSSVQFCWEF